MTSMVLTRSSLRIDHWIEHSLFSPSLEDKIYDKLAAQILREGLAFGEARILCTVRASIKGYGLQVEAHQL